MVRSAAGLMLAVCCAMAGLVPAEARRVALVIGNAEYAVGPLANPVRDAEAVAEVLEGQLGFDKVLLKRNLNAEGFRAALLELSRAAAGAEVAALFFAGHGTEVNGKNYLIPVDARLAKSGDLGLEAIPLDLVLEQLAGATRLKLVILDACRNNVFPMAGARRAVTRGLSRIEPEDNTLVVYAAKEGTTADDGVGGRHSPFTAALLKHIATPGLEVSFVFRRVRDDVVAATRSGQTPHVYGTLGGAEVYLKPAAGTGIKPPPPVPMTVADRIWAEVKDAEDISALEAFREHHGKERPVYDRLAAKRIEKLRGERQQRLALLKEEEKKRDPAVSAKPGSGATFRDRTANGGPCPECPEMVVVPAGSFTMGSPTGEEGRDNDEDPQRQVTIGRPFAVGRFEVTFMEWDACVATGGCQHSPKDQWGRGKQPVINVSWDDITREYLPWLSRRTGKPYRLLTEAEWEYVARAGTRTPFWWGSSISPDQANYYGDATYGGGRRGQFRARTVPVDTFAPNPWGLFNVHGNVWEWVQDCWHDNYHRAPTDGSAWVTGDCGRRILRGGPWRSIPRVLRAANRDGFITVSRNDDSGFRVGRAF